MPTPKPALTCMGICVTLCNPDHQRPLNGRRRALIGRPERSKTMTAQYAVRRNKTTLQDILSADYKRILDKVFENQLVTRREYNNLRDISREDVEGHVIRLVDRLMNKGEDTCRAFLHLLRTDEDIKNTFPELKCIQWDYTPPSSTPFQSYTDSAPCGPYPAVSPVLDRDVPFQESKRRKEDDQYQLTSKPTGLCVIINNENFEDGTKRNGTNKDAQSLAEVFSWLGFQVVICKDQTKNQMDQALKRFASLRDVSQLQEFSVKEWSGSEFTDLKELPQHGDAFICCILSHGQTGGISGIDRNLLSVKEITSTFNGANCSVLINKPKVFFIQACQGQKKQHGVAAPLQQHLEADASPVPLVYIPVEADFLVAIASVEDYASFRHTKDGSWFIQSLCQQLKEGCPRGDDLMNILYQVNNQVSQKEGSCCQLGTLKQMPEARKVTLRRRLVFSPCYNSPKHSMC